METCLLFSGGLDSYIAYKYLDLPTTLYANLCHRYSEAELSHTKILVPGTQISLAFDLGAYEQADANIPMRNLMLCQAAALEGFSDLILVCQQDEMEIPDRSQIFFDSASTLLTYLLEREIKISTPFADMDKTDMVEWYLKEGHPQEKLLRTWSCYRPPGVDRHCGRCPACFRRWVAFKINGIDEHHKVNPWETEVAELYRMKAEQKLYSKKRCGRIIKALDG